MNTVTYIGALAIILLFLAIIISFAWAGVLAAPWVPLWQKDVRRMLAAAHIKPGEKVYDLGAGDGRILITAAKAFDAHSIGFEIAFLPFFLAYIKILVSGKKKQIRLRFKNFYHVNLSDADVVCAFLTPPAIKKLKQKFEKELKPGCRVLSYAFAIPEWQPIHIDKHGDKSTKIFVYQR